MLLNAGITRLLNRLIANTDQALNASNCRVGVGSSNTAAAAAQTDLQGASKRFELCDSVSVSSQTLTVIATFGTADGNFAWEEWGIDFGTADGATVVVPLLNRKVQSMGTKASGATWTITTTLTVA